MRIAQLKRSAALVAVALGLTAAIAAISHTASADPPTPTPSCANPAAPPTDTTAGSSPQPKAEKDVKELEARELKALQGRWRAVRLAHEKQDLPAQVVAGMTMVIENDVMKNASGGRCKLTLYPDRSPKEIDLVELRGVRSIKGRTNPGIYKLANDKLTICFVEETAEALPKEFKAAPGVTLVVFERVKDED
jgi:uncharacterized protein (TIGR03067 family)